jgi:hypothetical protein
MPGDSFQQILPIVLPPEPRPLTHVAHLTGDEQVFHDNLSSLLTQNDPVVTVLVMPVEPEDLPDIERALNQVGGARVERIEEIG